MSLSEREIMRNGSVDLSPDDTSGNGPFGGLTPSEAAKKRWENYDPEKVDLLEELRKAAFGLGKWKDLSTEKRLAALVKCIEYDIGRPVQRKDEETPTEGGFSVGLSED